MTFPDWIKQISPAVKMGETSYFQNHEGLYYDAIPYVWKKMRVPVLRDFICIIDCFVEEAPPGKSLWTKDFVSHFILFSLDEIPKIKGTS